MRRSRTAGCRLWRVSRWTASAYSCRRIWVWTRKPGAPRRGRWRAAGGVPTKPTASLPTSVFGSNNATGPCFWTVRRSLRRWSRKPIWALHTAIACSNFSVATTRSSAAWWVSAAVRLPIINIGVSAITWSATCGRPIGGTIWLSPNSTKDSWRDSMPISSSSAAAKRTRRGFTWLRSSTCWWWPEAKAVWRTTRSPGISCTANSSTATIWTKRR